MNLAASRIMLTVTLLVLGISSASAHHRYHRHHRPFHGARSATYHHSHGRSHASSGLYICAGCVVRDTLAGVVAVSKENAARFVGVINALVHAGFKGPIHCAAPFGTHVRHSRHYSGNACDFAQFGWGKTHSHLMYTQEAAAIIRRYGFTNGCSFRDCGHVGTDGQGSRYARRTHYAKS